jgi:hypothetical protein
MPDLSPYAWSRDRMAICVAVVRGRTEDEVIDRYGGDPAGAAPATLDSAWERGQDGDSVLFVGGAGGAVLAVEDNGFQGSRPEVLREVTAGGGTMASLFWNVNMLSRFSLAEDGEVIVAFEGLFPDMRSGADPDRLVPLMRELGFRTEAGPDGDEAADVDLDDIDHDWPARCLALLAALTGASVTSDVLARRFRAVPLVPLPEQLYLNDAVGHWDPEVGAALRAAADDPDRLRRAAVATARATLDVAGLADEPLLVAALRDAAPGGVDRRSELGRLLGRFAVEGQRASGSSFTLSGDDPYPAFWRHRAGLAVRAALAPDPAVAAWAAATAGGVDLPAGAPVRAALLAALAGR